MTEDQTPWMRLLRELFGADADAALEELQRMGVDADALAQASGMVDNPAMMDHVLAQIRSLVSQSSGEDVNWTLAHDVARGVAAQGGDPSVSLSTTNAHRAAVTRAELWLDAVTDFDPSSLEPAVWSRAQWVESTMPTWRLLAGPVAVSVSRALSGILRGGEGEFEAGPLGGADAAALVGSVSPTVCGMHMGHAAGEMAREAFGSTDLGFPLLAEPRVALVPSSIAAFADGLDVDEDDVRAFLALREAAHVRLFTAAAWLPGQLHTLIERYATGVTIDVAALDDAVRDIGFTDPAALQKALTRGIFATHHGEDQGRTLEAIETLLALIEGWVQEVTLRAAAPHLPEIGALSEMMRRRRAAGGPAEDAFASLLGLELRPRRLREAARLWASVTNAVGPEGRDRVWSHPDLLPTGDDLSEPQPWIDQWAAGTGGDDVDKELAALLGSGDSDTVTSEGESRGDTDSGDDGPDTGAGETGDQPRP